jgi:hypothetical protein
LLKQKNKLLDKEARLESAGVSHFL